MSLLDGIILSGLIATVWYNLYRHADDIVARAPPSRPAQLKLRRRAPVGLPPGRRRG